MRWHLGGWAAVVVLGFGSVALAGDAGKSRKPQLGLRASPKVAFSPVEILLTGQLKGGAELEEFYCPGLEWDWGDGTRSAYESDCAPFEAGAELERFFSARHAYRSPGDYNVRLTLRRANRTVAVATVAVAVHGHTASASDPSEF
jgi:hypothetical protein